MVRRKGLGLTKDIWTSTNNNAYSTSLAWHFVDSMWCIRGLTLECVHFPGRHTGVAIAVKAVLKKFDRFYLDVEAAVTHIAGKVTFGFRDQTGVERRPYVGAPSTDAVETFELAIGAWGARTGRHT